jgi:hypothetical protein
MNVTFFPSIPARILTMCKSRPALLPCEMLTNVCAMSQDGCNMEYVLAVEALGMNLNFLIIILVVLAVILTGVVILAIYR